MSKLSINFRLSNPFKFFILVPLRISEFIKKIGSKIENYKEVFPKRVNVSIASILNDYTIDAVVWERGAGLTKACGTGACAILAAANRHYNRIDAGIRFVDSEQHVSVRLENGHILLGGKVEMEFEGTVTI